MPPFIIYGSKEGLENVSRMEFCFLDSTWLEKKHGLFCLSDKYYYLSERKGKTQEGKRCFSWIYMYCSGKDNHSIFLMLSSIKFLIKYWFGVEWSPVFYIDFDSASVLAIKKAFPLSEIRFCYFHWKQAVIRYASRPDIFGRNARKIINVEFTKLWRSVTSLDLLEPMLKVFQTNKSSIIKKIYCFSKKSDLSKKPQHHPEK